MKKTVQRICMLVLMLSMLLAAFGSALAMDLWGNVETSGSVHVRTGPGLDYDVLKTLENSTIMGYVGETRVDDRGVEWYKVWCEGSTTGWVSSTYAQLKQRIVVATGGQTYVRTEPSLDGEQLKVLHLNEEADYMERTQLDNRDVAWYRVCFDGSIGWVSSKYTELMDKEEGFSVVVATDGQTNIRTIPSLDGRVLIVLKQDEVATFLNCTRTDDRGVEWYEVQYKDYIGWVSSRYTELH